jgi:hypothetical protein
MIVAGGGGVDILILLNSIKTLLLYLKGLKKQS